MTAARYVIAGVLALVGVVWIGQGMGLIGGSFMSNQPVFAILGAALLLAGAALAWSTRRAVHR